MAWSTHFAVTIPDGYDPSTRYQVRVQLHGGVMNRRTSVPPANAGGIGALAGDEPQIYLVPFAWDAAPWWSDDQLRNLRARDRHGQAALQRRREPRRGVGRLRRRHRRVLRVDARHDARTPAFCRSNGFWGVLAVHDLDVDGPLFPGNMRNKPFFIVNGERDPLYPPTLVEPAIAHYRKMGLTFDYHPQAGAGHNTQWWPQVKGTFEAFVARASAPSAARRADVGNRERGGRSTARTGSSSTRSGHPPGDSALDDPNLVASQPRPDFGARSIGNRINRVMPGSNAERIGLKAGDALVRLNDETVHVAVGVEEVFKRDRPRFRHHAARGARQRAGRADGRLRAAAGRGSTPPDVRPRRAVGARRPRRATGTR